MTNLKGEGRSGGSINQPVLELGTPYTQNFPSDLMLPWVVLGEKFDPVSTLAWPMHPMTALAVLKETFVSEHNTILQPHTGPTNSDLITGSASVVELHFISRPRAIHYASSWRYIFLRQKRKLPVPACVAPSHPNVKEHVLLHSLPLTHDQHTPP